MFVLFLVIVIAGTLVGVVFCVRKRKISSAVSMKKHLVEMEEQLLVRDQVVVIRIGD